MPFDVTSSWVYFGGLFVTLALLVALGVQVWRGRLERVGHARKGKCGFRPARLTLSGQAGEVLSAVVEAEGPASAVFATFVEEPWVVVSPSAGMFPQQVEISVYTKHAPPARRHTVTVRLLPVDGESQFGSLELTLKTRKARGAQVGSRL